MHKNCRCLKAAYVAVFTGGAAVPDVALRASGKPAQLPPIASLFAG